MDQDKQQDKQARRIKVTGDAAHKTGTKRAAIKPHKRTSETNVKQVIADYMASLKAVSLSQTYYGSTITKNAATLRTAFGLAADDEPYLLADPTGTGRAGMLLSASGLHLADGRGGTALIAWKDLPSRKIACQRTTLAIGQSSIATRDAQVLAGLLQTIQGKLSS